MRARHEHQIKLLNSTFGREFDKALDRVIRRLGGLDFFNDAQIALLREEMILTNLERRKLQRESRKHARLLKQRVA